MKKILFLALSLSMSLAYAQEQTIEVSSDIEEVNLFLQGAQVTRKGTTPLQAGISRLVFTGISEKLDPNSIQVGAQKEVIILSVTGNKTVQMNPKKAPIIRMLEDSIEWVNYALDQERNALFVLEQQESLLLVNKELKGDKGVVLIDLEDALIIYQKQLAQIKQQQLDSKVAAKRLETRRSQLTRQLAEFRKSNQQPSYEVVVTVSTAKASRMESLTLSYFINDAMWIPGYDIRVDNLNKPVKLHYKADLYNNTGENWDNVKVTLSSGNPNLGGTAPVLNPQLLGFTSPSDVYTFRANKYDNDLYVPEAETDDAVQSPVVQFDQKNTSFEFTIPARLKVVANNQPQNIDLLQYELNGQFDYFTVPKLEEEAFLISKVTGWESLSLLVGEANIYFEGTFLGKTIIDPSITSDTLSVSLGRDKGVVVKRAKLKEFCSSNFSGSKKKEILVYEITIKNNKAEAISIQIQDQIPVASNKEISVEVTNISGAELIENSGKLIWNKSIASGETIKLRIEYEVRYPKDKGLSGL
ncbi:MAG: DUF4139 domain-containing protein [Bacteroidota bacterium]|nr:DUF4139 domain-containing protein [Bacteroidota bacterium]MDX5430427.1 DUF4139 domain-containing protein [Bacteroidota bacterium]MDX5469186.1 DUF4139 domain-containing protein [Bacteroidota bacterium]